MPSVKRNARKMKKGTRKSRNMRKMKGGDGAADYAIKVYGDRENQVAGPDGHTIKMNSVSGGNKKSGAGIFDFLTGKKTVTTDVATPAPTTDTTATDATVTTDAPVVAEPVSVTSTAVLPVVDANGNKTGGNVLQEIAVPAVLLYANNMFGKRKSSSSKKSYKGKRSFKSKK